MTRQENILDQSWQHPVNECLSILPSLLSLLTYFSKPIDMDAKWRISYFFSFWVSRLRYLHTFIHFDKNSCAKRKNIFTLKTNIISNFVICIKAVQNQIILLQYSLKILLKPSFQKEIKYFQFKFCVFELKLLFIIRKTGF